MQTEVLTSSALRSVAFTSGDGAEGVIVIDYFGLHTRGYQCVVEAMPLLSRQLTNFAKMRL